MTVPMTVPMPTAKRQTPTPTPNVNAECQCQCQCQMPMPNANAKCQCQMPNVKDARNSPHDTKSTHLLAQGLCLCNHIFVCQMLSTLLLARVGVVVGVDQIFTNGLLSGVLDVQTAFLEHRTDNVLHCSRSVVVDVSVQNSRQSKCKSNRQKPNAKTSTCQYQIQCQCQC